MPWSNDLQLERCSLAPKAFLFTSPPPATMAVRIRLAMHGIRHNRIFHMVAIDHEARRNAKPIETLAIFDPKVKLGQTQKTVQWSVDRIRYWLEKGAKPSESAIKLMTMVRLKLKCMEVEVC